MPKSLDEMQDDLIEAFERAKVWGNNTSEALTAMGTIAQALVKTENLKQQRGNVTFGTKR